MKSYEDLEIYQLSYKYAIEVHKMTMSLPNYEMFEQGSQIRRSSKSVKDNIAEGFGRRRYKADFIRFLIFAHASSDEAISQLNMINSIHFSDDPNIELKNKYVELSKKINKFIQYVETSWRNKPATCN